MLKVVVADEEYISLVPAVSTISALPLFFIKKVTSVLPDSAGSVHVAVELPVKIHIARAVVIVIVVDDETLSLAFHPD